jgi:hypothetical protein
MWVGALRTNAGVKLGLLPFFVREYRASHIGHLQEPMTATID